MSHLIPITKQPRRGAVYNWDEIAVISKYKAEYKEQTTKALRAHVLRNKILVDIFNYWDEQGILPTDEKECVEKVKVMFEHLIASALKNTNNPVAKITIKEKAVVYYHFLTP